MTTSMFVTFVMFYPAKTTAIVVAIGVNQFSVDGGGFPVRGNLGFRLGFGRRFGYLYRVSHVGFRYVDLLAAVRWLITENNVAIGVGRFINLRLGRKIKTQAS